MLYVIHIMHVLEYYNIIYITILCTSMYYTYTAMNKLQVFLYTYCDTAKIIDTSRNDMYAVVLKSTRLNTP